MKFLKRKSQRDDIPQYSEYAGASAARPPSPVSKDSPSTPLYARYARMTTNSGLDSPGGTLSNPAVSRFGALNDSNASGFFANPNTSSVTASTDAQNDGNRSHGRASGSNTLDSRPSSAPKPEPIKLKSRKPRTGTDDNSRVTSMVLDEPKSLASTRRSPNDSAEPPANVGVHLRAKEPVGKIQTVSNDGMSTSRDALPGAKLSHSSLTSQSATQLVAANQATNANTSNNIAPRRVSKVPTAPNLPFSNGVENGRGLSSVATSNDHGADLSMYYNAAVRLADAPRAPSPSTSPTPARPKEGPPIAIRNRAIANRASVGATKPNSPSLQDQSPNNDILVKPPSRRESLQSAARVPFDSQTPPLSPALSLQRSPSPAKTRTVVTSNVKPLDDPDELSAGFTGFAGVGAFNARAATPTTNGAHSSITALTASPIPSIPSSPVTAIRPTTPTSPPAVTTRFNRAAGSLNNVPSGPSHRANETTTNAASLDNGASGDEFSPAKSPQLEAMARSATPPAVASSTSTPKASNIPIPTSGASSSITMRQSRLGQTPISPVSPQTLTPGSATITPVKSSMSTAPSSIPVSDLPFKSRHQTHVRDSVDTPSRQSSSASAVSSSPSATRSRSTGNSTNGLLTPEDTPVTMTAEPAEISKVTLRKGSTKINGVTYNRDQPVPSQTGPPRIGEEQTRGSEENKRSHHSSSSHYHRRERKEVVVDQSPERVKQVRHPDDVETNTNTPTASSFVRNQVQESNHISHTPPSPTNERVARPRRVSHNKPQRAARYMADESTPQFDPDLVYPIERHLANPDLLAGLLNFLQFTDWVPLSSVSKKIRNMLEDSRDLREEVLECYLGTVGYNRWDFGKKREPLVLTLRDLNSYLRGVSIPIHRYSEIAEGQNFSAKDGKSRIVRLLASSTRAYSKVVLRLRAQAEAEVAESQADPQNGRPISTLLRAQSPSADASSWQKTFHSPLYRIGHAPLLRVFVPSPDGPWLSDTSVLACEKELKRAGIVPLMKIGDVVWDTAVSDEAGFGNVGRLIWDGNYLIDLDYTFSTTGDIPPYLHSLSFPPAYFHKVLRSSGNPVMQIDLRPWGKEIASNIQLVQDRVQAETPQGGRHTVMRWVHRTRFQVIRNMPIPDTNLFVDAAWEGNIVIETEGTNEGLADLQLRCGMEWFKPQPGVQPKQGDGGRVYKLLRERSRPGEIWLRTVRMKERIS